MLILVLDRFFYIEKGILMKKCRIGILLLGFLLVLLTGCKHEVTSISKTCSSSVTESSAGSFSANKGDKVNIEYYSKVKSGSLKIQLIDPNKNVTNNFETNLNGKEEVRINKTGEYTVRISLYKFKGNVNVRIKE